MNQKFASNEYSRKIVINIIFILAAVGIFYWRLSMYYQAISQSLFEKGIIISEQLVGIIITASLTLIILGVMNNWMKKYIIIRDEDIIFGGGGSKIPENTNSYYMYGSNRMGYSIICRITKDNIKKVKPLLDENKIGKIKELTARKNLLKSGKKKIIKTITKPEIAGMLLVKNPNDLLEIQLHKPIQSESTTSITLANVKNLPKLSTIYISPKDPEKLIEVIQQWQN